MSRTALSLLLASSFTLGGCAYGLGGLGGPDILGSVLGGVLADDGAYGAGERDFAQAAVNACGNYASRYGRASVTEVTRASSSTLRVHGLVEVAGGYGYDRRGFECDFRSDGRITDFDIA